ncbi:MAG: phospholipid carrier-dependent glycosyltransferase [Chloroflexi bacterium]|nr:phospholipid carrier-dependent glycosyltransferase [Chloroflexota bacterium]
MTKITELGDVSDTTPKPVQTNAVKPSGSGCLRSPLGTRRRRQFWGCVALWLLSVFLIFPNLGSPRAIVFDETYFIPTTQKYLNGVFFLEPHPPLAKLLITAGQLAWDPEIRPSEFITVEKIDRDWSPDWDITGYRFAPAIFGTLIAPLTFLILSIVLESLVLAFLFSVPVVFDNALIVQSRAALIDSFLLVFALASILVFAYLSRRVDWRWRPLILHSLLWGVLAGCAASVKLTGLAVLALLGLYGLKLLWARQIKRGLVVGTFFSIAFLITYLGLWVIHFSVVTHIIGSQDYGISEQHKQILNGEVTVDPVTRLVVQMKDAVDYQRRYEAGVPKLDLTKPDEIGSPWYWWMVGGRAIDYRWETPDGKAHGYVYLLGNPMTWLVSLLGVILGTALILIDLLFAVLGSGQRQWLYSLVALYWGYMIPIMFIERVMYLYHYLLPMIIGVMLFALVFVFARRISWNAKRVSLTVIVILVIVAFWAYKPFTYNELLTSAQFQQLNIWAGWGLQCVGCQ